jgi:penicillin-binding protein 2
VLVAFIVAVIAAVVAIIGIAAFFALRARSHSSEVSQTKTVSQVDTVGVGTSSFERRSAAKAARDGEISVNSSENQTTAQTPADSLSARFKGLGIAAAAIFGALGARLWSMQILENEEYAEAAEKNLYTTVNTPAPRGGIYDRNGIALVLNRPSQTVVADSEVSSNTNVIRRLSAVLGLPASIVTNRIKDTTSGAQSLRVVGEDVPLRQVAFIAEHADAFPGITVEERTQREYPYGALAAHVLGYTGAPSEDQLSNPGDGRTILSTDMVGRSGIESQYDDYLAGAPGETMVMVDANGNRISVMSDIKETQGSDVYLTLDAKAQYVADKALADLIAPNGIIGKGKGTKGSIVALDVTNGEVLVMSSYPTFDPTLFTGSFSEELNEKYQSEEAYGPLNNNAISGQFMAASTYKGFTSMAGLEYGFATQTSTWNCTGKWDGFGTGDVQRCWKSSGHGTLDLHGGIVNSCDTVFYEIGKAFYDHGPNGSDEISETALQDFLHKYGLGELTGIDLAGEAEGRVPTPAWKEEAYRNRPADGVFRGGDYTNMVIGQGDVLVTPLQIAAGYAGLATGKIMKPHLLKEVHNSEGDTVVTASEEVWLTPDVSESNLAYVQDALHDMVQESTSVGPLFKEAGIDAAGKSGTGEKTNENDTAWFVAYAPYDDPKYVVACVVEQGGGGSDTAAPLVVEVMSALFESAEGKSKVELGRLAGSTGESVELEISSTSRED